MAVEGEDGPIILAIRIVNINNNNDPNSNPNYTATTGGDILAIRPQDVMFELTTEGAANLLNCRYQANYDERSRLTGLASPQKAGPKPLVRKSLSMGNLDSSQHALDSVQDRIQASGLTDEQLALWNEQGYLIVRDMLNPGQLEKMVDDIHDIADNLLTDKVNVKTHPVVQGQRLDFGANGRVLALLAENAFDANMEPLQRIQRLGTGVHRVLPNFRSATFNAAHQRIAQCLGFTDPRITQSLVVTKAAANGAKVIPHQDGCSSFTNPPSCVTFWYALEDSTIDNGCLKVMPGSHRTHPITRRCCRDETGRPQFRDLDLPIYMQSTQHAPGVASSSSPSYPSELEKNEEFQNLEVPAGTLILMHGNLVHASEPNHSAKSRIAFNFGVVEGSLSWLPDNYLQPYDGETEFERLAPLS